MKKNENIVYGFGIMSNKYEITSKNKLTAYATMLLYYYRNPNMIVIYYPEDCDTWFNMDGTTDIKLDSIFGGNGEFEMYLQNNSIEIKECLKTIKKII